MSKAGKFSMVSRTIWRSERFKSLPGQIEQLAYFYFLTCDHQNGIGCYRLPDGYAIVDLGWQLEVYQKAKTACVSAGLIDFDDASQELLVQKWLVINPPQNQKHLTGLLNTLQSVESDRFREKLETELLELSGTVQPADDPRRPRSSYRV